MELNFEECGSGKPLIILHGLFGSLDNWRTISKALGAHFRVFAIDQRNHGRSPHSDDFDYQVMAEDLREFMSDHKIASAAIMGHSMGGKTAMLFSFLFPNMVDTLIVVDVLPRKDKGPSHDPVDTLKHLKLRNATTYKEAECQLRPYIKELRVRQFFLKNLRKNEMGYLDWGINLPGIIENYDKILDEVTGNPFHKACFFIRGENSNHIRDDDFPELRRHFPQAKLITIPGAGHWVHADNPEVFIRVVHDLLKEAY